MNADLFARLFAAFGLLAAAAAAAPLVARKRRAAGAVALALVSGAAALLLSVSAEALFGPAGPALRTVALGPVAVPFLVDGVSAVFLAVIALMAVASALYSIRYMDHYPEYGLGGYYLCYPLFVLGMAALVTVDDLALGFSLAWQVMTVASFFLVRFERRKAENRRSAAKYLVLMEAAWVLVVAAAFLVDGYRFGQPLAEIASGLRATGALPSAAFFGLLLVGFGLKAGVWPLGQLWLPDAHSIAPSPVSALLSGVMIKTGVYGLLRTFLFMPPAGEGAFDGRAWGLVVAAVGAVTLLVGTVQSMKQSDAKRLLAYSSIGQVGYIVLATGAALYLGTTGAPALRLLAVAAAVGALFHFLNHAVFKGLLFLTSGSILYATGTKDLNRLGGLIRLMPVSAAVAGVASLSISGMPPFSGFSSKWTIVASNVLAGGSFAAHKATVALVLFGVVALFTSVVTLACYVKFFGMAFTSSGAERHAPGPIREVPGSMLAPKIALAAVALAQGLFPALSVGLALAALGRSEGFLLAGAMTAPSGPFAASALGVGLPAFGAAAAPLVVLLLVGSALALGALLRRAGGAKRVEAPTWLCGYQELNEANRYADRGMFAALRGLFKFAGGKSGK
ncbi:MAG TPA: proton-conducting transporter membrane subunit [Candidatus Aminicenantes bacterium]|nr:proton-conducting transporter membrane subunit [Candidatus Aminicenantes bacterium]